MKSRKRTKAEQARSDAIHAGHCLACMQLSKERGMPVQCGDIEEHHLDGRTKKGAHLKTVGLGSWHHRGVPHRGWLKSSMEGEYGPSLANGSKPFHARFGSDKELLTLQDRILGVIPS